MATSVQATTSTDPETGASRVARRYEQALARTHALIERSPTPEGKSLAQIRERAVLRLGRVRRFLAELGDPHLRYPVVHVGGTSGKGSTSTAIAAILSAAGYRTGLHTSPYLQVATEKIQIDGQLLGGEAFADLVDRVVDAADAWHGRTGEHLTYGEVWIALFAAAFADARVDVAVVEVGAGGRFDLTNVVEPEVSVITSVGLDHTVTLGPTIPEIAWHKAGIIKAGAEAITAVSDPAALAPIVAEAAAQGVDLRRVSPGTSFDLLDVTPDGVVWQPRRGSVRGPFRTALPGRFQAVNAALAVEAVQALERRGFAIEPGAYEDGLGRARVPGRSEVVQERPRVILDGAHNPQKMAALAADLPVIATRPTEGKLIAVAGMLESKDHREMLETLAPEVDTLILTTPRVVAKPGTPAALLAEVARAAGFGGTLLALDDPGRALQQALEMAHADRGDVVVVTGSLYLVGNVRGYWYPDSEVLLNQTPWPPRGGRRPGSPTS